MFFDFGVNNTNTLVNFLQEALAKNNEFEIRFGKFYQNTVGNERKTAFDSTVDIDFFYALKRMFEQYNSKKEYKNTREIIYKNEQKNGNIKRIIDLSDNSETVILKNSLRKYDIYDYDLRLSIASEKTLVGVVFTELQQELIRNILLVKTKHENLSLRADNIMFDNIIMTDAILKNFVKLSKIK
jgi:hypothetical protein